MKPKSEQNSTGKPTARPDALPSATKFYYLPLLLLAAVVVLAVGAGVVTMGSADTQPAVPGPVTQDPAATETISTAAENSGLPAPCRPPLDQGIDGEPWSNPARQADSEARFNASIADHTPGVIQGLDGWVFFDDFQVQDLSQSIGRKTLDQAENNAWADYLTSLNNVAHAQGSDFYIVVVPGKWDVVPDKLPTWAQELRGTVSLDLLMSAHPELPFIDIRPALREQSDQHRTYSPLNSHWTRYGGFVGWSAITQCLRAVDSSYTALDTPKITGVKPVPDSNEYESAGIPMAEELGSAAPIYASPHGATTTTSLVDGSVLAPTVDDSIDMMSLPVRTDNPQAQTTLSLLALRDSTGSSLSPLWSESFGTTYQYLHGVGGTGPAVDLGALLAKDKPDITMLVLTERYLAYPAPAPVA